MNNRIQIGPEYRCFTCGAPAQRGDYWPPHGDSPLDALARHIYYLDLPCDHSGRCARLGDAITPLTFAASRPGMTGAEHEARILRNVQAVRDGLAYLAANVPPGQLVIDTPARVVYELLAGQLAPQTAIETLREAITRAANQLLPA